MTEPPKEGQGLKDTPVRGIGDLGELGNLGILMRLLIEEADDGISIGELNTPDIPTSRNIIYCNSKYVEMSGRTREELMSAWDVSEFSVIHNISEVANRPGSDAAYTGLSSWIRRDGRENFYEWSVWMISLDSKRYLLGIERDVTQKIQDEKRFIVLRKIIEDISRHLDLKKLLKVTLTTVMKTMRADAGSVMLLDETGKNIQVALAEGRGAKNIKGVTVPVGESIAGKVLKEGRATILHNEVDIEKFPKFISKKRQIKSSLSVPVTSRMSDDGEQTVLGVINVNRIEINEQYTESDKSFLSALSSQLGIAVLNAQAFEREKRAAEQLRLIDYMRADFVSSVTHELRTPLVSLRGYTSLLSERGDEMERDQKKKVLKIMSDNTHRLERLVDQILAVSGIERGVLTLETEEIGMEALIEECVEVIRGQSKVKHPINIKWLSDPGKVEGDRMRLEQVLVNLLSNAVKYSPQGGSIEIVVEIVSPWLSISVKDQGLGIAEEHQSGIFEKFKRIGGDETKGIEGTGIGLYLVKEIVDMHKGEVELESEKGKGSVFTIRLPLMTPSKTK